MNELIVSQETLKATQDNQLIEACYSMTLNEKRLLLFAMSKVNPSTFPDASKPFSFEMTAKEWAQQFGDDNPWRSLKRTADKLLGRYLTLHPKAGHIQKISWFDSVDYFDKEARIVVEFELLSQFKSTGYRVMTVEDFRWAMDVVNTNKGTKELKRAVLNPAVKQVNEKSDLFCIVTDIKQGVRITGFKFTFRTQEQKQLF